MNLRTEHDTDHAAVRDVHLRASGDHGPVVAGLVDALRAGPGGLSLVAEVESEVVGHVFFTAGLLDAPPRLVQVQVLSPLAVVPEHQGRGIGTALVRRGLQLLADRGVPLVFLEGPASFYPRAGFVAATERGFRRPSLRIPEPAFQVAVLPAYEPWMTGTLVYPPVFWEQDVVGLRDAGAQEH